MKRAIVASILGIAATVGIVNNSHAQGTVVFCNYADGGALTAGVTYTGPAFGGLTAGETIGSSFTADLLYSLNGGVSYTDSGITAAFLAPTGTPAASGGGLFGSTANSVTIPGYSAGACDFIVEVYNGATFAASTVRGQSSEIVISPLATAGNLLPTGSFFDGRASSPITAFTVAQAVPEPTTMALGGLGLAALLVARRKKA